MSPAMRFALLVGLMLAAAAPPALAQDTPARSYEALSQTSRAALDTWLKRDCEQGVTARDRAALEAVGGDLEALLVEAYQAGLPPVRQREAEAAFGAAYEARARMLAEEGERMFGAEQTARMQGVDRTTYVQRRIESATLNYRTNAVVGLGVIGARGSAPLLSRIAVDPANPMREAARLSLAALRAPPP